MNSDNLQVWNNAAFDDDKENRQAPAIPTQALAKPSKAVVHFKVEEEDRRCIDVEIEEIEREIRRLSSRLEDLKLKKAERDLKVAMESSRRGRVVAARFMDDTKKKKVEEVSLGFRRRGMSLGPLDITPLRAATQSRRKSCFLKGPIFEGKEEERKKVFKSEITPTVVPSAQSRRKSCFLKNPIFEEEEEEEEEEPKKKKKNESVVAKVGLVSAKSNTAAVESSQAAQKSVGFRKRGVSLGPVEIASSARTRQIGGGTGSGLPGIKEEEKVVVVKKSGSRSRSLSVSPKSRRPASKVSDLRKGVMTVGGAKKAVKKGSGVLTALRPKALFQDEEEKKPLRDSTKRVMKGRTVPSRYGIIAQPRECKRRKWSLPEKEKEEEEDDERSIVSLQWGIGENFVADKQQAEKKREEKASAGTVVSSAQGGEKKTSPVSLQEGDEDLGTVEKEEVKSRPEMKSPICLLPKIQTSRCVEDSPRDSGPLKRVIQLVGRRTFFGGLMDSTCCQDLSFEAEEQQMQEDESSMASDDTF